MCVCVFFFLTVNIDRVTIMLFYPPSVVLKAGVVTVTEPLTVSRVSEIRVLTH